MSDIKDLLSELVNMTNLPLEPVAQQYDQQQFQQQQQNPAQQQISQVSFSSNFVPLTPVCPEIEPPNVQAVIQKLRQKVTAKDLENTALCLESIMSSNKPTDVTWETFATQFRASSSEAYECYKNDPLVVMNQILFQMCIYLHSQLTTVRQATYNVLQDAIDRSSAAEVAASACVVSTLLKRPKIAPAPKPAAKKPTEPKRGGGGGGAASGAAGKKTEKLSNPARPSTAGRNKVQQPPQKPEHSVAPVGRKKKISSDRPAPKRQYLSDDSYSE